MSATRFSEYESRQLHNTASKFIDRIYSMVPFPDELLEGGVHKFYRNFFPEDLQEAMLRIVELNAKYEKEYTLIPKPFADSVAGIFYLDETCFPADEPERVGNYEFKFDVFFRDSKERIFITNYGYPTIIEGHPYHAMMHDYVRKYVKTRIIATNAKTLFRRLTDHCKTPGQWNTVFPQFKVLLTPEQQRVIAGRRRNSPWPTGLSESVRPKLPHLANLLAKCALLPEYEADSQAVLVANFSRKTL